MLKYLILIALIKNGLSVAVRSDDKKTVVNSEQVAKAVPVQGVSQGVKDVPSVVKDVPPVVPEVVKDVPKDVKNVPKDVKDVVEEVKDVPKDVKDAPKDVVKEVKDVPKDVKDAPKDVVKEVKDVPKDVQDVPKVVKDVPQVVKDVPQVVKDVPQVVKDVPEVTKAVPGVVDGPVVVKEIVNEKSNVTVEEYEEVDRTGPTPSSLLRDTAYACAIGADSGYCYTAAYCTSISGKNLDSNAISSSNCPQFGKICCQIQKTCGGSTDSFVTVFKSSPTDLRTATSCNLQINAADDSVCQIRIDFVKFTLSQPTQSPANTPMQCNLDSLVFNGVRHPTPKLCGILDGQHVYLHINQTEGEKSVTLQMNLANRLQTGTGTNADLVDTPSFEIRITQLQCPKTTSQYFGIYKYKCSEPDFNILAPLGCLQYFTDRSGTFKSFTYDTTRALTANRLLASLNYAICFKKFPNSNCLKMTSPNFQMSGGSGSCNDRIACSEMMIANNGNPALVSNREACGTMISSTAIAYCPGETPFVLKVRTDTAWNTNENGFVINYENPPSGTCPSP